MQDIAPWDMDWDGVTVDSSPAGSSGGANNTREGEDKANAFLIRALGANKSYEKVGVGPRSYIGQLARDSAPNLQNSLPGWIGNSDQRQVADVNQDEFIAASLRQDSGAAIPPEEMERQRRIYFPMPGDSDAAIEAKRQARLRAIQGLVASAGRAVKPETLKGYPEYFGGKKEAAPGAQAPAAQPGTPASPPPANGPQPGDGAIMFGATAGEQEQRDRAITQELNRRFNAGESAAQIREFARTAGFMLGDDFEKAIAYRDKGGRGAIATAPVRAQPLSTERGQDGFVENADAFVRGVADTATLGLADELSAAGDTIFRGGTMDANLTAQRATDEFDALNNPYLRLAGQVTGGFALPVGAATTPGRAAAVGAGYGAGYGAGSANGDIGDRAEGALYGGAIGGAVGGLAHRLLGGIGKGGGGGPSPERIARADTAAAAQRQGVDLLPADVGGPTVRRMTAAAAQGPVSASPIVRAGQRVTEQAQAARDRIASDIGEALDIEAAGETARRGAEAFIQRTSKRGRTLYDAAEGMAAGVRVPLSRAKDIADRNIAELSEVPGGSEALDVFQRLRSEIDGDFTVPGIRQMRSQLRDRFAENGLRGSDLERRVNQVIDATTDDIADGLAAAGRQDAASAYRAADRYWRLRVQTIDNALAPVIGKNGDKSAEQIVTTLQRFARSDSAKLAKFVRALPEDEQATVRATLVSQLGRANPGAQDAAGNAFSLPQFLTHWNQMTSSAKASLFSGESRAALDDLAKIADGAKQAQRYQNHSNTAGGVAGQVLLGGGSFTVGGLPGLIASTAAQYVGGRLLAWPRFARWLARAPKENAAPPAYVDRLSKIAAAEPAIAQDVLQLQRRLQDAFGQSPTRLAAEEGNDKRAGVERNNRGQREQYRQPETAR